MTLTRSQVRDLLDRHGIAASKSLGQHFVVDPNTVRRIARLAEVGPGDRVLEIGAGLGSLTLALAQTGASVTAVEVDRDLLPLLREVLEGSGVSVLEGDARHLDWTSVLGDVGGWVLVANLPYNVATPLVCDLLAGVPQIERMLVMVQREAGERLVAAPGSPSYGLPSVAVARWATGELVGRVPSTVFHPEPAVESVLVRLVRRPAPACPEHGERALALARRAFGQRRKMLRRSLADEVAPEIFERAGVQPEARPEELGILDWCRLAAAFAEEDDQR